MIRIPGWIVFWLTLLALIFPAVAILVETLDKLPAAPKNSVRMELGLPLPESHFL